MIRGLRRRINGGGFLDELNFVVQLALFVRFLYHLVKLVVNVDGRPDRLSPRTPAHVHARAQCACAVLAHSSIAGPHRRSTSH